jgi:hypothetical protein
MLKTVSSVANALGALNYKGTWNADTNTPTLASGVGTQGDYYVVSVAGATDLDGITNWGVGDWAAFNGSVWQRVEGGADGNFVNLTVTGTGKIDDLIVGATSAPQAGVNLEVKSATSELRLSTSDGSITNGETIGKITWNAPDEGSGPNAIIVAGEISLVSDGNWDSTRYTPSNIVFKTTPVNGPTMVEAARFTSTGNLAFPSGQGIDFSATGQAPGSTSELFDDYEEGTWTPANDSMTVDSGTFVATGTYVKVGKLVFIDVIQTSGTVSAGSGVGMISGFPFVPARTSTVSYSNGAGTLSGVGITETNSKFYGATAFSSQTALRFSSVYTV